MFNLNVTKEFTHYQMFPFFRNQEEGFFLLFTRFKTLADGTMDITQTIKFAFHSLENILGKGEMLVTRQQYKCL